MSSRRKGSAPQKRPVQPEALPPPPAARAGSPPPPLKLFVANVLSKINVITLSDEAEWVAQILSILKEEKVTSEQVKQQYMNPRAFLETIPISLLIEELRNYKVLYALDIDSCIPYINTLQNKLQVRPSSIEAAGNGLYALSAFENGATITFYGGIRMSENIYLSNTSIFPPGLDAYLLETPYMFIDGRTNFRLAVELGRWITHSKNRANCKFVVDGEDGTVSVRATRDIEEGEELFLNYGNNYWTREEEKRLKLGCCVTCGKKVA